MAEVKAWRDEFRARKCEWCQKKRASDVHEIARGADRSKALDKSFACLALCRRCHEEVGEWSRGKQLSLLLLRRPGDFDLPAYHAIIARRSPDIEEVLAFLEELK